MTKRRLWLVLALGMAAAVGAAVGVTVLLPHALRPDPAGGEVAQQDDARGQSGSNVLGSKLAGPDATPSPTSMGASGTSPSSGESSSTPSRPPGPSIGTPDATLITNEYAYHHEGAADAVRSPDWIVTSGSLFAVNGQLWSGHPDDRAPGPASASGTDSAVLRAVSTRTDHGNVRVSLALRPIRLIETERTPRDDIDGVHIFLHYQSEFSTYYVSVFRRDGTIAIKKKVAGGPSNGGTYFTLASAPSGIGADPPGTWHQVEATVSDSGPGGVRLTLSLDGRPALDVLDDGATAPVIGNAGRVGLRGDNCEFYVRDFRVEPLAGQ